MSEQEQPRKKLSLSARKTLTTNRAVTSSNNLKNKLQAKKESSVSNFLRHADSDLASLYEERNDVVEQIKQLEQRLQFAKSEPLQEFLIELKSKDFDLLAKINDRVSKI
ncbi:hypothetical protein ACFPDQ_08635 [Pseudofrancisella aestuarii]|uniref:Uncharacterized protein n=1 Tax=Pseudofrancisella aestuarii TaxID=2670347 RepID=A0ABV9TEP6_9GAMM|nr:hypothetical protein [Pseudofrancisella aestuarii]